MSGEFQNIGVGPRSDSPASDEVEVKSSSRQQKVAGGVAGLSRFPHQAVLLRFRELTCAAGRIAFRCRCCGGGHHHLPARCICTLGARASLLCSRSHVVRVLLSSWRRMDLALCLSRTIQEREQFVHACSRIQPCSLMSWRRCSNPKWCACLLLAHRFLTALVAGCSTAIEPCVHICWGNHDHQHWGSANSVRHSGF